VLCPASRTWHCFVLGFSLAYSLLCHLYGSLIKAMGNFSPPQSFNGWLPHPVGRHTVIVNWGADCTLGPRIPPQDQLCLPTWQLTQ
jgi:hypothetical protein